MSIKIKTAGRIDQLQESGYKIKKRPTKFRDWKEGENEGSGERAPPVQETLERGRETELCYSSSDSSNQPPSISFVINGKDLFERLQAHNSDNWWQYRSDVNKAEDIDNQFKRGAVKAIASNLGLNDLQQQRVFRLFMKIDLPKATGGVALNVFVICSLVANEEAQYFGRDKLYHPQRPPKNNDPHFQRLADDLIRRFSRITTAKLTKVYNKLTQGNPPTRSETEWLPFVRRNSFIEEDSPSQAPTFDQSQLDHRPPIKRRAHFN